MPYFGCMSFFPQRDDVAVRIANRPHRGNRAKVKAARKARRQSR